MISSLTSYHYYTNTDGVDSYELSFSSVVCLVKGQYKESSKYQQGQDSR